MTVRHREAVSSATATPPAGANPLREANLRFQLAFERAPIGVVLVGPGGEWTHVNPALCQLLGRTAEELLGLHVPELTHPDDLVPGRLVSSQALAEGRDSFSYEKRYLHADGHIVPVKIVSTVVRDEHGELLYIVAQIVDQTEAVAAAAAQAREVETIGLLTRVAVAANEAGEPADALTAALAAVCEYTGWSAGRVCLPAADGVSRLPDREIWHGALDDDPAELVFASPVLIGSEVVAVLEFFAPLGSVADLRVRDVMASVGTQLGRVIERDRLASERRALDVARAQFVANAAHELRTPLATMSGLAHLVATRRDVMSPDQFDDCVAMLERQGKLLDGLVADLLDLSRIEHGEARLEPVAVLLADIAPRALATAPVPSGTEVTVAIDPTLAVLGNPQRCERVLVNLLTNAYRHGGRAVVVRAERAGSAVVLEVADDGPGVPDDLRATLWEPFTRAAGSADVGGAGLGLAITRRLVETMDGSVEYRPAEPAGARFLVRLPEAP